MPFWQSVQRCENCKHWKQSDPSNALGQCEAPRPDRMPFWAKLSDGGITHYSAGNTCPAYTHDKRKPHPLDRSAELLARTQVGDIIPMRTYRIGEVSRTTAEVLHHSKRFITIRMMSANYRLRVRGTEDEHGGTVIAMPEWGIDPDREITRAAGRTEHPERAASMLAKVKVGDFVLLIGYPPLDGQRRAVRVTAVHPDRLWLKVGRRRVFMHRNGPLAGVIPGDVWCLDTTGEAQ